MSFTLKGRLTDGSPQPQPLSAHTLKFFDKDPVFDVFGDDPIGSTVTLTMEDLELILEKKISGNQKNFGNLL